MGFAPCGTVPNCGFGLEAAYTWDCTVMWEGGYARAIHLYDCYWLEDIWVIKIDKPHPFGRHPKNTGDSWSDSLMTTVDNLDTGGDSVWINPAIIADVSVDGEILTTQIMKWDCRRCPDGALFDTYYCGHELTYKGMGTVQGLVVRLFELVSFKGPGDHYSEEAGYQP